MIRPEDIAKLKLPPAPPVEYAGQWVAWNKERTEIIAHGKGIVNVYEAAVAAGYPDALLQKVRVPGVAYIGTT